MPWPTRRSTSITRREGFRWLTVGGQRRAFQVIAEPMGDAYVCAYALDVTEAEDSREALKRHAKAHDETLDTLEDAVAIFGPESSLPSTTAPSSACGAWSRPGWRAPDPRRMARPPAPEAPLARNQRLCGFQGA
ncbi:MAG: hypothetical protein WDN06_05770 [Asticcacaulis sp.]